MSSRFAIVLQHLKGMTKRSRVENPAISNPSLEDMGLARMNETSRVGLRDLVLGGYYQNETGEVYRGVTITAEDVVVDVGCGSGGPLEFLSTRGAKVIAVDVSNEVIAIARENIAGVGGVVDFRLATTQEIPVSSNFATRVVCMEVLEHVDDPEYSLSEMYRIGQSGALYVLTVPDAGAESIIGSAAGPSYFQKPNHIRIIGRDEFENLVRGAGLEILEHTYNGFFNVLYLAMLMRRGHKDLKSEDGHLLRWAQLWNAMLDSSEGLEIKAMFDEFLPRNQIIVARKP